VLNPEGGDGGEGLVARHVTEELLPLLKELPRLQRELEGVTRWHEMGYEEQQQVPQQQQQQQQGQGQGQQQGEQGCLKDPPATPPLFL